MTQGPMKDRYLGPAWSMLDIFDGVLSKVYDVTPIPYNQLHKLYRLTMNTQHDRET